MAKHKKKISDKAEIDAIIRRSQICHLGMSDEGQPYVVPLSFGYDGEFVYCHCNIKGKKLDILRKNPRVCLTFSNVDQLIEADQACEWDMEYQSVVGFGTAKILEEASDKIDALNVIMSQYTDQKFSFPEEKLKITAIIKVGLESPAGREVRFS